MYVQVREKNGISQESDPLLTLISFAVTEYITKFLNLITWGKLYFIERQNCGKKQQKEAYFMKTCHSCLKERNNFTYDQNLGHKADKTNRFNIT